MENNVTNIKTKAQQRRENKERLEQEALNNTASEALANHAKLEDLRLQSSNNIEAVAANVENLLNSLASIVESQLALAQADYDSGDDLRKVMAEEVFNRFNVARPQGWLDIANQSLRQGFAAMRRALEQPTHF